MSVPLIATGSRVIVESVVESEMSAGGIYISDKLTNPNHTNTGTIISIGPEVFDESPKLFDIGDTIYHARYAGETIEVDGKSYRSLESRLISAVVNKQHSTEE